VKRPFRLWNEAVTCSYHSEHSNKGRWNSVKCLAQRHNKRTCRPTFPLSLFYAERQVGKLWTWASAAGGRGAVLRWIFIHITDIVDIKRLKSAIFGLFSYFSVFFLWLPPLPSSPKEALLVLFFNLFSVASLEIFLPAPLTVNINF